MPSPLDVVSQKAHVVRTLAGAGIIRPTRPDKLVRVAGALRRWGPTPAAGYTASAVRYPDETAIIDDLGTVTFGEVAERSNRLAHALADEGVREGDGVAIMCRNHRFFIDIVVACSKLGAHALFLNTMFAGPQIRDVLEREGPTTIVFDEEFTGLVEEGRADLRRIVAWQGEGTAPADLSIEALIANGDPSDVTPPSEKGRVVILTSGTTGTPKGARRSQPESLDPAAALLSKIPLKARERTHVAAPMFHSWGFAHFTLGLGLSSTLVLRRKFTPEGALQAVAEHRCTALAVVPVMLQRILDLPEEARRKHDTSSLRVIAASGSALPGPLATRTMDEFGDVLYNLYGSTEVAWATIATPQDLRAAPGTAGRPPRGTVVKLLDGDGKEVPTGETGRIFVANGMLFEGYTGGGNKEIHESGLMSTGDMGVFDEGGRLHVSGRDDDMIVSGGENVFPREVEDTIAGMDGVEEVAVIGVEDEQFGQRLKAFVVTRDGASVDEDAIKKHVRSELASYKVPREIEFIDELPRNATGKVLKRELA